MQNLYGILLRWNPGGVQHLIKRAYRKKPCPPCEKPKVTFPQRAKQVQEKVCSPCKYQMQRKHLPFVMPKADKGVNCKELPCKGKQTEVNECDEPAGNPKCPEGNWDNPKGSGK